MAEASSGSVITSLTTEFNELAVRLGSIISHDRRGTVYYNEDFEGPVFNWNTNVGTTPPLGAIFHSSENVRSGGQAVRILTPSATGEAAGCNRTFQPQDPNDKLGMELSFSLDTSNGNAYLYTYLALSDPDDSGGYQSYGIMLNRRRANQDCIIYIGGNLGAPITTLRQLDTVSLLHQVSCFQTLKFVIDPLERKYVRLIINNQEWDISNINAFYNAASGTAYNGLRALIYVYNNQFGVQPEWWIDDFILTQNEPDNS